VIDVFLPFGSPEKFTTRLSQKNMAKSQTIVHQPIDFPEIAGDFPFQKATFWGEGPA